jgi:hypothetical protein
LLAIDVQVPPLLRVMLLLTPAVNTCLRRPKRRSWRSSKQQATSEKQGTSDLEVKAGTADTNQCCRMQDTQQTAVCRWVGEAQATRNSTWLLGLHPFTFCRQLHSLASLQLNSLY